MPRKAEIQIPWDAIGEGALDLSFLQDAPAGRHGFITARDGHFFAEDGTRIRFFGVNLVFNAAFPEPDQAPVVAERLARAGVNLVRVHHADMGTGKSYLDGSGGNSRKLSASGMALFDRLFYELKQRGIYLHLDLYTLRRFQPGDGLTHPDEVGLAPKWITYFDERLIQLQEEMAEQWLSHLNPHTGLRYADDPAIAVVQIVNENTAFWWNSVPPAPYLNDVQERWNRWLLARFGDRDGLAAAWTDGEGLCGLATGEDPAAGTVALTPLGMWNETYTDPDGPVSDLQMHPVRAATWRIFLDEVQTALYRRRAAHLRGLGVRCCINGTNLPNGVSGLRSQGEMDVCEHNGYWDHPLDDFKVPMRFHMAPSVRSEPGGWGAPFTRNLVAHLSSGRVAGKPFVVTEYYQSMPNPWRAECVPMLSAYASHQDWDGLCLFSFSHGDWTHHARQPHLSGCFNGWNDPSVWGTLQLSALLFRRGDIARARRRVAVAYSPVDTFLPHPDWGRPYSFLPFLSQVESLFTDGAYQGDHDVVLTAGFTPTMDCTGAQHALVYSRSPFADLHRRRADPEAVVRTHRPDLLQALEGGRLAVNRLPAEAQALSLWSTDRPTAAGVDSKAPPAIPVDLTDTVPGVVDQQFCLIADVGAMASTGPDWLRQTYAAAMRAWGLNDGAGIEPGRYVTDTGELDWDYSTGLLKIDSPRSQGLVGFGGGRRVEVGQIAITLETGFGVVAASSLEARPLAETARILVTAVGRSRNSEMVWNPENPHQLLDEGREPVTFDPVEGWLDLPPGRRVAGAWALDVRGARAAEARVEEVAGRYRLRLGSGAPALHYEIALA
ncbi:MAG: hypothetical protein ACOY94_14315 [Bacillota bacterium]